MNTKLEKFIYNLEMVMTRLKDAQDYLLNGITTPDDLASFYQSLKVIQQNALVSRKDLEGIDQAALNRWMDDVTNVLEESRKKFNPLLKKKGCPIKL